MDRIPAPITEHVPATTPKTRAAVILLVALTAVWGSTFSVMKNVIDQIPPARLMLWRFSIASVILLPFVRGGTKLWLAAFELGFWLFVGYATQVVGLLYTTPNRSAFITSTTVIFVPIFAAIAGKKVPWIIWFAAILAMIGAGFLSYDVSKPNIGDALTVATAISYALFIYRLEWASRNFDPRALTAISMIAVALMSAAWVGATHPVTVTMPWKEILFLGVVATAITTTLQTYGQRQLPASQVGVIYTLEPVFAAIFSYFMRSELLGDRGWIGAALIILAALLCQFPIKGDPPVS